LQYLLEDGALSHAPGSPLSHRENPMAAEPTEKDTVVKLSYSMALPDNANHFVLSA